MSKILSLFLFSSLLIACAAIVHGQVSPQSLFAPRVTDGVTNTPILPSSTSSEIREFDEPHWVYVRNDIILNHDSTLPADRRELLLYIPGTQPPHMKAPEPGHLAHHASHTFCLMAASLGYHVISLSYPNSLSASSCNNEPEPSAFEEFRLAIISGGATKHITVTRPNSIENRLIKLLSYLAQHNPQEGWDAFLNLDGSINWEKIAVAGQSQGGGHAALIGIHHHVSRVLCFGAPKDYSIALRAPAAWYLEDGATPKERYFAFNHEQDHQGCSPEHQLENLKALKLDQFGPPTLVDGISAPYNNTHILMTNYPGSTVDSATAHGTMLNPKNKDLFADVWKYMLTK